VKSLLRPLFAIIAGLILLANPALGQAVYGNIIGTVTDPSGASVPNADVAITDTDRGISYQTKSNADGNYGQTHLLAGHYRIRATVPGFAPWESPADVQVDASTRADARLTVQAAQSTVDLLASRPCSRPIAPTLARHSPPTN
jgi:hypothetical protein